MPDTSRPPTFPPGCAPAAAHTLRKLGVSGVAVTAWLDLSHILLADHDIAAFATKPAAASLARARGWPACDIIRAFNRFNMFWVVGERLTDDLRLATRGPGVVHVPYRFATPAPAGAEGGA